MNYFAGSVLAAALLALAALGIRGCQEQYREQGRAEVRADWAKADQARKVQEGQALIARQQAERADEQRMARRAEENDLAQTKREQALRERAAAADRAVAGLRGTVAKLNADSAARRAQGSCPAAEREAHDAATARGLLGACAGRYSELGRRADELAARVIGLQDHIVTVQPEAAALLQAEPPP